LKIYSCPEKFCPIFFQKIFQAVILKEKLDQETLAELNKGLKPKRFQQKNLANRGETFLLHLG